MKQIFTYCLLLLFSASVCAQRSDGTIPVSFTENLAQTELPKLSIPRPEAQIQQIRSTAPDDKVLDFGVAIPVSLNLLEAGLAENTSDGKRIIRFALEAPGAYGINLNFARFQPGKSGKLWVYSADKTHVTGGFDIRSVNPGISFATAPVPGEKTLLEFVYDPQEPGIEVEIAEVVYEFEDLFSTERNFGSSGACNININCPEYTDKANPRRSVAMILTANNVRKCTGTLVNNTAEDGKPYFLTARHCNTTANSIFMFNYESPDCSNLDGPINQTLQGCTILVNSAPSDVTLLELSSPPPGSFFTYFSGWNANPVAPDSSYTIHHPRGDIKKISVDRNLAVESPYAPGDVIPNHWKILNWESGTTEPGSSGSPLFNFQNQVLGQLHGGQATCANSVNDYYGRFDYSWNGEGTPETALRFWLDPLNTGQTQLNGFDFNAPDYETDLAMLGISVSDTLLCGTSANFVVTLRNEGLLPVSQFTVRLYENGVEAASAQFTQTLQYGHTFSVSFTDIPVGMGVSEFSARVEAEGLLSDENPANDTAFRQMNRIEGEEIQVSFLYDLFSGETKWGIYTQDGSPVYLSGPAAPFQNEVKSLCLADGCYMFRVTDSGSDGICCSGGEGSFEITGENGEVILSYAPFENLFEQKFCVPALPVGWEPLFQIYPNPAQNTVNIKLQSYAEGNTGEITLFSPEGKVLVRQTESLKYLNTFDVSKWASGVYFVRVSVGKLKSVQKFIKL